MVTYLENINMLTFSLCLFRKRCGRRATYTVVNTKVGTAYQMKHSCLMRK